MLELVRLNKRIISKCYFSSFQAIDITTSCGYSAKFMPKHCGYYSYMYLINDSINVESIIGRKIKDICIEDGVVHINMKSDDSALVFAFVYTDTTFSDTFNKLKFIEPVVNVIFPDTTTAWHTKA